MVCRCGSKMTMRHDKLEVVVDHIYADTHSKPRGRRRTYIHSKLEVVVVVLMII